MSNTARTTQPEIIIKKSSDLRNSYNEISTLCHEKKQPVFLTKNGEGDLAIMSIEYYNKLICKNTLYAELLNTEKKMHDGETMQKEDVFALMAAEQAKYNE